MSKKMNGSGNGTDYAGEIVPLSQRSSAKIITMSWWGCCSSIFWIILAATMASLYGVIDTIIGIVLTCITYSLICAIISRYAITTGLSVSLFSQTLFGKRGAAIATLIFAISALWYAVFESSVIAVAATYAIPGLKMEVASLLVVLLSVPLVFGRVQGWLNKLNLYLLPLYILGLIYAIYKVIDSQGYSNQWITNTSATDNVVHGWWHVYVTYMGIWTLIMFCMDYARFGKPSDKRFHSLFTFGMPFYGVTMLLAGVCGIFIVKTMGWHDATSETAAVKALIALMGIPGLIFVWATQTRINSANFYLATINLEGFWNIVRGKPLNTVFAGTFVMIATYLMMLADVFQSMLTALAYQGIFVVAWVSIAITHILKFGQLKPDALPIKALETSGLLSWFGAVILGIIMMHSNYALYSAPGTALLASLIYFFFKTREYRLSQRATVIN